MADEAVEALLEVNYPTERKQLSNGVIDLLPSDVKYEEDEFFNYYDKEYATYYEDLGIPESREKAQEAFALLSKEEVGKIGKIIDIGCGPGVVLDEFAKLCNANISVGTDLSSFILDVATKETKGHTFIRADSHRLPFKDKAFDCALMLDVIEHIPGVGKLLEETKRVSKLLVLKVPLEKCLFYDLQCKVMKVDWKKTRGHINIYTKDSVIGEIEKHGFKLVRSRVPRHRFPGWAFGQGLLFGIYQYCGWLAAFLPESLYRKLVITELIAIFEAP